MYYVVNIHIYVNICPFQNKVWLCLYVHINMWDKIIITVEENIIGASKMRNNIWYSIKMVTMVTFLNCSSLSDRSSNFAIAKVVAFNLFGSLLLFCIACHILIVLPTCCHSFIILRRNKK